MIESRSRLSHFFFLCLVLGLTPQCAPNSSDPAHDLQAISTANYDLFSQDYLTTVPLPKKEDRKAQKLDKPTNLDANTRARATIDLLKRDTEQVDLQRRLKRASEKGEKEESPKVVADTQLWKNIELCYNEYQRPDKTIVGLLKRTETSFGEIELINLLTNPITDVKILKQRQHLLKTLAENDRLRLSLKKSLRSYGKKEDEMLSLFCSTDLLHNPGVKQFYKQFEAMGIENPTAASAQISSLKLYQDFNLAVVAAMYGSFTLASGAITLGGAAALTRERNLSLGSFPIPGPVAALLALLGGGFITYGSYMITKMIFYIINVTAELINYLRQRIGGIKSWLATRRKIISILKTSDAFKPFHQLILSSERRGKEELRELEELINAADLETKRNLFKPIGPLMVALKKINTSLAKLSQGTKLVGLVDAFVSMATLYKEHADKPARYSFVEYTEADTPYLNVRDFWHPAIPADKVVTNSIELGAPDSFKDVILTGPNTAGKSSVLKSLTLSVLLGQTFGIAPASACTMTTFGHLNTYAGITDNLAEGISLFQAEMNRAKDLIVGIQSLPPNVFSFTVLDEIFTGTEPVPAEGAAYSVGYDLAQQKNSLSLIATHLPGLTQLEKDTNGVMKNLKVHVEDKPDGTIGYPYTLVPGINTQQIAIDLMLHHNFSPELVQLARELIDNPQPYVPVGAE